MPGKKLYEGGPLATKDIWDPVKDPDTMRNPAKKAAYMKAEFTGRAPVDPTTKPKK